MSNPSQPPYGGQHPQFNQPQSPYPGQAPQPPYPGQAPRPQSPRQPPTPQRKRRWFVSSPVIGVAALVFGIILGAASAGGGSATSANPGAVKTVGVPGPTVTATSEPTATATKTVTAKPKPAPTKTVTVTAKPKRDDGGSASPIGDGTYVVGSEIKIGNYKSSGGASDLCYADTETESGNILDQQVSQGAPVVIRITSQAYTFESNGCGTWHRIG